jgi:hypothetical protein
MNPTYNPNADRTLTPTGYMFGGKEYVQETRTNADGNQYKVDVLKGSAPAYNTQPNVSTTTISNENKVGEAIKMNNTLDQMKKSQGISVDPQGNPMYSNGTAYQETQKEPVQQQTTFIEERTYTGADGVERNADTGEPAKIPPTAKANEAGIFIDQVTGKKYNAPLGDTSALDYKAQQVADQIKARADAETASTIDNIKARFASLIRKQEEFNRASEAKTQNTLLTGGVTGKGSSAQYAPLSSDRIVAAQVNYGLDQIADLVQKENELIAEAEAARYQKNYPDLERKLAEIANAKEKTQQAAIKLNDKIAAAEEKKREELLQSTKDTAIADLYASGVTDTASILKELRKAGMNVSAQEVSSALKNSGVEDINKVASLAAQNGAPLDIVARIGQAGSVAEANALASGYLQDPLETAYKKAQIAKIYSDIEQSNVANAVGFGDASQLVAYAQQYAATGQIPSGLPKGSFGVVSQVAKELPKQKGEIVSAATGVAPTKDSEYASGLASMTSVVDLAKQLKELDKQRIGGVVSGTTGKVFGSTDQQRYVDQRSQIIDLLSRARSGAALTASEEKRYAEMLPGRFSEPFGLGVDSDKRIDNFINAITSDLQSKAASKGWAIYGVSKVNINGDTYTVGDIVDNGEQKGRINPDGSITVIQ